MKSLFQRQWAPAELGRGMARPGVSPYLVMLLALLLCAHAHAQVNSGSNGSDGAFNPTTNIVINMADHPTGIYHYTSVNISNGVTVTFIPNANNTPVVWLVQSNCVIAGNIYLLGQYPDRSNTPPPGGYPGGNGGSIPSFGQGPGGGGLLGVTHHTEAWV